MFLPVLKLIGLAVGQLVVQETAKKIVVETKKIVDDREANKPFKHKGVSRCRRKKRKGWLRVARRPRPTWQNLEQKGRKNERH